MRKDDELDMTAIVANDGALRVRELAEVRVEASHQRAGITSATLQLVQE